MNIDMACGLSVWDTVYRYGYLPYRCGHLEIDMGYGLMIREMTVSILSSPISIRDILTLFDTRPLFSSTKALFQGYVGC